ncbi:MAG: type II toxin-antitoxin system VapC family toxin [Chloroflexota bacterium]
MKYLLDSDWIIDVLAGIPSAVEVLDGLVDDGAAISLISVGELFEGAFGFPDPDSHLSRFRQFIAGYDLLGFSERVMERFARIRNDLRRRGQLIPDMDLLIAATAIEHALTLLTRNIRHFSRIPELQIYRP